MQGKITDEIRESEDQQTAVERLEEETKENIEKEFIENNRNQFRRLRHPVTLVRASAFMAFQKWYTCDELHDNPPVKKSIITLNTQEELENFLKKHYTIYFAHAWTSESSIDNENNR